MDSEEPMPLTISRPVSSLNASKVDARRGALPDMTTRRLLRS